MVLLPVFLWLIVWAVIAVVVCAVMGLPFGTRMLETTAAIFVFGGLLLPLAGLVILRYARHRRER